MANDFVKAAKVGLYTSIDYAAGSLVASVIDSISPPIANQGPLWIGVEGIAQMSLTVLAGVEMAKLITPIDGDDPTFGMVYQFALFENMPKATSKLSLLILWLRQFVTDSLGGNMSMSGGGSDDSDE